jgi:hypothetical protein
MTVITGLNFRPGEFKTLLPPSYNVGWKGKKNKSRLIKACLSLSSNYTTMPSNGKSEKVSAKFG